MLHTMPMASDMGMSATSWPPSMARMAASASLQSPQCFRVAITYRAWKQPTHPHRHTCTYSHLHTQ